jgi:predicted ABC-type ATPase
MNLLLDRRPVIVAIAGANGSGKSTFFHAHLASTGLRFVNADLLARELALDPYAAAEVADMLRRELVKQRESFVFETVFSDPVEDKLAFLRSAQDAGYTVVLCFIGISGPVVSEQRVSMRVAQGGHDVPNDKLRARFPRTIQNFRKALVQLGHVWVFDNEDLGHPFRLVAMYERGRPVEVHLPLPSWFPRRAKTKGK